MAEPKRNCELCKNEATVYCASDAAYLCFSCDSKVHSANFLVARHFRSIICSSCRTLSDFPGNSPTLCRSCSPEDGEDCISSSSSSCVSSTTEEEAVTSRKRKRARGHVAVDLKVEGVLGNWCRRLPVDERRGWEVVSTAVEVLGGCLDRMTVLPFRVALAASFWVAMRVCCCVGNDREDTCRKLRRLEQISGVPAKLILATESRLARVLKRRRAREDHEEGWAES